MPTALITDGQLHPISQPIQPLAWDIEPRLNEVGPGMITVVADPALLAAAVTPDARVSFVRDTTPGIALGGPIENPGELKRAVADGVGTATIRWADNLVYLGERLTYPDPAAASTAQTTAETWSVSATNAETVLRSLVNLNAGPGALTARRVPGLALGDVAGVGSDVTFSTRFEPLLDALRTVALAGGGLGFRIVESGGQLLLQVYQPVDRSGSVWFSFGRGNLRGVDVKPEAPTVTAAIVGGQGEGTARTVVERTSSAGWRRVEKFVDQRQAADSAELQQAGDVALTEGAAKVGLTAEAIDTPTQRYGTHYQLGDKVAVEYADKLVLAEVVRAVRITGTAAEGETVKPIIGAEGTSSDDEVVRAWRDATRRVGAQERR